MPTHAGPDLAGRISHKTAHGDDVYLKLTVIDNVLIVVDLVSVVSERHLRRSPRLGQNEGAMALDVDPEEVEDVQVDRHFV